MRKNSPRRNRIKSYEKKQARLEALGSHPGRVINIYNANRHSKKTEKSISTSGLVYG